MTVTEGFADPVTADFREIFEDPAGSNGFVDGEEVKRPGDTVVQRAIPLKGEIAGEEAVGF